MERLVTASLEILEAEGPEALTVQAVVGRAGSSVGSFYARFGGKDDLLLYLSDRVWREALERWQQARASRDWSGLELPRLVESVVGLIVDVGQSSAGFLNALDRMPGGRSDAAETFEAEVLTSSTELLLARRDELRHPDPEMAVSLGLRAVAGVAAANGRGLGLERDRLIREGADLLMGYLVGRAPADGDEDRESVDFFDVWG
ncbi:MAG: TetR/AcrR family transcriptional regulator [Myxococcales bacterium]|nr:TetR/AcrR family transcriptional regulator [Myxococcales bacterium]